MVNLSGRGDKDIGILARELDLKGADREVMASTLSDIADA